MTSPKGSEPCPFCHKPISRTAERCPYCGEDLYEAVDETDARPRRGRNARARRRLRWLVPIGRSGWSIAAGYLGVICLFAIVGFLYAWFHLHRWGQLEAMAQCLILGTGSGILAVTFGIWGLMSAKGDPRLGGRGRAIFGIVAGSAILVPVLVVVLIFFVRIAILRR